MSDYILDKLNNMRSVSESISDGEMRLFAVLMKREYLIRLMTAILWDAHYSECSSGDKNKVFQYLFGKKPSLGDFVSAIRMLSRYSSQEKVYKKICEDTSSLLIYNRNQDAHKISAESNEMIQVIDKWVGGIKEKGYCLFSDAGSDGSYEYSFLIPLREINEKKVQCICFGREGSVTTPFKDIGLFRNRSRGAGYLEQLYYCVENIATEEKEVYKLSPFIHYFGRPLSGIFTLFSSAVSKSNNELVTDARSLFDERLSNEIQDDILSKNSCRIRFTMDFPVTHKSENFYISALNSVMVNKSSYHEFQLVANNEYKYAESIVEDYCRKVYSFCEEKKSQLLIIAGGGGLGKTALLWNVIQKIMGNELRKAEYDLIIFLSAKQNYLVDKTDKTLQMTQDVNSDIEDFPSFKYKLMKYVYDLSDAEMAKRREESENMEAEDIEKQGKSILLMIDDMDMLVPEDQEKICRFASKFSATKLKTVIATRNVNTNGSKIELQRLDRKRCVEFARWLIEGELGESGRLWLDRLEEEAYQRSVFGLSRGIPVFVQKWVRMLVQGVNCLNINNVFTERDCVKYLYYTVRNQLKPKEAQMIYMVKEAHRLCGMRVFTPFFLYIVSPVESEEERDQCLQSLISFQLIQDNGDNTYSLFDFDYSCIDIADYDYYKSAVYQSFFVSMEEQPDKWKNRTEYLDEMIRCLEAVTEYDQPAALLLDKLCSGYGSRYCSAAQSRTLTALQSRREAANAEDAETADIMGEWDGRKYDVAQLNRILDRLNESVSEDSLVRVLDMVVECCGSEADEALVSEDDVDPWIRDFAGMWDKIKRINSPSEEVKELKRKFSQYLRRLENA